MRKTAVILMALLMAAIVGSEQIFEYNETDYINLRPSASDPDDDSLTYYFSYPLSSKGTWQTDYGDAGIYNTKVTVSDGRLKSTENITLIIHKKEEPPRIDLSDPKKKFLYIKEGEELFFHVEASDLNDDPLGVTWHLDGNMVSDKSYYTYRTDYYSEGNHSLVVRVNDSKSATTDEWMIQVEDFDRTTLLDDLESLAVNETETISLQLPDFAAYDLEYDISEPIGDDGIWRTTYDDSGLYTVNISIQDDKSFYAVKKIKILVQDVDRPPEHLSKDTFWISETEHLEAFLNYTDPDDDPITLEVAGLPKGAEFRFWTLSWTPDYDTVTKENFVDAVARNFHLMNRVFKIYVNATSNNLSTAQELTIRVFNSNRHPVITEAEDITVREGEKVKYEITAYDPDNDSLSYSYHGFDEGYTTKPEDAGIHNTKIVVSAGFLSREANVKVRVIGKNHAPVIENIMPISAKEGTAIEIPLSADDIDNDALTFDYSPKKEAAYIKGNTFYWDIPYTAVTADQEIALQFTVSDGALKDNTSVSISVQDVNRAPKILTSSQLDEIDFYTGELIELSVEAIDPDDDPLTYKWKTSMFDSFQGNSTLRIRYDSPGTRAVSVIVSDGKETDQRTWQINIEKRKELRIISQG